jgi:ABC-type amino acid transport substrate-binding protein
VGPKTRSAGREQLLGGREERDVSRASRIIAAVVAVPLVCVALSVAACAPAAHPQATVPPKLQPPVIKSAGVLRVGVDRSYPPFAGIDDGKDAGIDIDVASALAGRLGLKAQFVDVKASSIATALADRDVDVVMSSPFASDVLSRATIAGTYLSDGPALFSRDASAAAVSTATIVARDSARIGAQQDSEAYWLLVAQRGSDGVTAYPTLREAFAGLSRGEVDFVAGDALVGAYIARDTQAVRFTGALAPAHLLGIAVTAENTKLADSIRTNLDALASDGVLETIRATWVGTLPKLPLPSADASAVAPSELATP